MKFIILPILTFLNKQETKKAIFLIVYTLYIYESDIRREEREQFKMLPTTCQMDNNTSGNGQFGSLLKKRKRAKKHCDSRMVTSYNLEDYTFIGKNDRRMRFNNSKDPIFYVFDVIESRPVTTLAKEFVRDAFKDTFNSLKSAIVG